MKKILLLYTVAILATLTFFSCEPKPGAGEIVETPSDAFCGTYDLVIVTDSMQNDGTWFNNSSLPSSIQVPTRYGRLTITKTDDPNRVDILGRVSITGDSVDIYKTIGYIDEQGILQIQSFVEEGYINPMTSHHEYTFTPITAGDVLTFKSDAAYTFSGSSFVERATNTATKRQ